MQIESLRVKSYRSWRIDDRPVSDIAKFRFKKLQRRLKSVVSLVGQVMMKSLC